MKQIHRSYKFKLNPNCEQEILLNKSFGCARFVYNYFLEQRIAAYKRDKTSYSAYDQIKQITQLKKQEEYEWLKEVNTQSLQQSLLNLESAYKNFFREKKGFPKFKSKKNKNTFKCTQRVKIKEDRLFIPKFKGGIKCVVHRKVKGEIKSATISKTTTGKYFVSLLVLEDYQPKKKTGKQCGVDLGIKTLGVVSDGTIYENNKYTKKYASKLANAQQHLSRKQKGSNSYERQRRKVAKVHEKIKNAREDVLHKISHKLVSNYDVICLETLNVKGMVKNRKLSKSISDASWGKLVEFISYKADWNDKEVVRIDQFFPSSKTCSVCGSINKELKLKDREWTCERGHFLDRDVNAAQNILVEGLRIRSERTSDNTVWREHKTKAQFSVKPEAQLE